MKLAVLKEQMDGEKRVAATPETVQKFCALGLEVTVEKGAGENAGFTDAAYKEAGATIQGLAATAKGASIILKVQPPVHGAAEISNLPKGAVLISHFSPFDYPKEIEQVAKAQITAFSLEMVPRITRAQSMDVLSSQSNLAGYRAVLDGCHAIGKAMPMMMTAAGTVKPANVLVIGAGVAGLQAIATAKRLGAVVSAFDVRPAAKEQVESLGASFVEVPSEETQNAETSGGYAKEMSDVYKKKQEALLREHIKTQDMVITTALIPGKPAPKLISEEMVNSMPEGSVIVDLAAPRGGNCELTQKNKNIMVKGTIILGDTNTPSKLAKDASQLFARNVLNFINLLVKQESNTLAIDRNDEIIAGTLLTYQGKVVHPMLKEKPVQSGVKKTQAKRTPAKKPPLRKQTPAKAGTSRPSSRSAKNTTRKPS